MFNCSYIQKPKQIMILWYHDDDLYECFESGLQNKIGIPGNYFNYFFGLLTT